MHCRAGEEGVGPHLSSQESQQTVSISSPSQEQLGRSADRQSLATLQRTRNMSLVSEVRTDHWAASDLVTKRRS